MSSANVSSSFYEVDIKKNSKDIQLNALRLYFQYKQW
jgi:hypothetical protein